MVKALQSLRRTTRLPRGSTIILFTLSLATLTVAVLTFLVFSEVQTQFEPLGTHTPCEIGVLYRGPAGIPALRSKADLGPLMQARGFTDGAEVGVQSGVHAQQILQAWTSCQKFHLVDLWGHQENYKDSANVVQDKQDSLFQSTQNRLQPWRHITTFHRMLSTQAAQRIPDQSLDFVYIDARHDYCGVTEDLRAYYPKLRPGGILAGHDFLSAAEIKASDPAQDWSLCMDGTVNAGAVKGAVEQFALDEGLTFSVVYAMNGVYRSWLLQKPTRMECVETMGGYGSDLVRPVK
jgi:hypothetical protein|uniref:Methyltransferase n=1 Tax=Phaeodactylum tricornutum TaxID=2850 RepID=A0A8J9SJD4_PHATR